MRNTQAALIPFEHAVSNITATSTMPVSLDSSLDLILLELYQKVSLGPSSLMLFLTELFQAERAEIITHYEQYSDTEINTSKFFIDANMAALIFYHDQALYKTLRLKFSTPNTCHNIVKLSISEQLSSHIKQACAICHELATQQNDLNASEQVIDHYPLPMLMIDNNGQTVFLNKSMRNHFQKLSNPTTHMQKSQTNKVSHLPLNSDADKVSQALEHIKARSDFDIIHLMSEPKSIKRFKNALEELSQTQHMNSRYCTIQINKKDTPIVLTNLGYVPNLFRHYARESLIWVHTLNTDYSEALANSHRLQNLGLSKTEQALCCQLFEGQSLNDIAQLRGVSKQTVRKQLQSILRKTHCDSQESLIQFLFEKCLRYGLLA